MSPEERNSIADGQGEAARYFGAAIAAHRLSHAYLLVGKDEDAKLAAASGVAKMANCEGEHALGAFCGVCPSCRQIDAGTSPYLRIFGESGALNVEMIDQFIAYASLKVTSGHLKVSVFRGVDYFTDVAGDRILKTIEEPVPGNVFLLFSQNSRRVLTTIRSRTQVIKIQPYGEKNAGDRNDIPAAEDIRLTTLLEFVGANLSLSETVSRLLKPQSQNGLRDSATSALQAISLFVESVLRARAKVPPLPEISLAIEPDLARVNFVLDESRVRSFLDRLGERFTHVEQNVNPELVLTNTLLQLRRMIGHE